MADNYLEKKMEDLEKRKTLHAKKRNGQKSLTFYSLVLKNRSHRGYKSDYKVSLEELKTIILTNRFIASTKNQQILRFKPIVGEEAKKMAEKIKLGGLLPELNLPQKGFEPNAFIIVCTKPLENTMESKWTYLDLGISLQTMLLKAVSMGLNGICIGAYNKECAKSFLPSDYEPLIVVAIGKGAEKIEIKTVKDGDSLAYFRENGIHYVPKIEDIIL